MAKVPTKTNETITAIKQTTDQPTQDAATSTEIATLSQKAVAAVAVPHFKVKRQVTRPLLKHHDGDTVYIRIIGEPYVGKEIKSATRMAPAMLVNVNNLLNSGRGEFTYILSSVVYRFDDKGQPEGELVDAYPNHSFVGKCFAIKKFPREQTIGEDGKVKEKRYNNFEIVEVDDPAETA